MTNRKATGVGLFSGGLDSILAAKVLQTQGIEIIGVTFATMFFGGESGILAGNRAGIPVQVLDIGEEHLEMLKKPVYGFGRHMNPCIDCHALMLREAGRIMEEQGADFLFTGEVLGQRPMSQRREALKNVERLAGYPGRILRPLSARLLPPTDVEMDGLVDREQLLDIQGRSRKPQMALAEAFGITEYLQPGGGCILTNEGFGRKLAKLLELFPNAGAREVALLKGGRHFVLPEGGLCVIGRNQADNQRLESLAVVSDVLLRSVHYPGPVGLLLPGSALGKDRELAELAVLAYSDAPLGDRGSIAWWHDGKQGVSSYVNPGKGFLKEHQV